MVGGTLRRNRPSWSKKRLFSALWTPCVNAHNNILGQTLFYLGEVSLARQHFEQGLALYDPQQHNPRVSGFVQDPGVAGHTFLSFILWRLGYPDQALQSVDQTLTLTQELSQDIIVRIHQQRRVLGLLGERETLLCELPGLLHFCPHV